MREHTKETLLTDLLRRVSRSFYLTLNVLPKPVRNQIGLAYLLARASDTIADTELLPADQRLALLDAYGYAVQSQDASAPSMNAFIKKQADDSEAELLRVCHQAIDVLRHSAEEDRVLIREVLDIIISGQKLDLKRFHSSKDSKIVSLDTPDDLNDYTYRVAGSVGAFWTRMCLAHLRGRTGESPEEMERLGIRYGQGLQLVNILRDFQKDLSIGRCYLPRQLWEPTGWRPETPDPHNEAFKELWKDHVHLAIDCLTDGWRYTMALPTSWTRVRLSCSWPILLGIRTISMMTSPPLPNTQPAKVVRADVYEIMLRTMISAPFPLVWDKMFRRLNSQVEF
jgi:farnesyl-diphosphate farnesyltransferase